MLAAGLKAKVGPWTFATVRHRVAVLSNAHRLKHVANPCEQPAIRTVLSRAARAAVKRGERPRKKTAIPLAELEAMLATCDDSLEGIRDRALLCFGFASGGRRRSEIGAADFATCAASTARPSRPATVSASPPPLQRQRQRDSFMLRCSNGACAAGAAPSQSNIKSSAADPTAFASTRDGAP